MVHPSHSVGASGPSSSSRSQSAARSVSAMLVTPRILMPLARLTIWPYGGKGCAAKGERLSRGSTDVLVRGLRVLGIGIREQWRVFTLAVIGSALYGAMTVASAFVLGRITVAGDRAGVRAAARPRPARWPARPRSSSASRSSRWSASSAGGSAPGSCSSGCRPRTAAGSPGSTCGCRWPGTSSTRPARCCPTRTPTSRPAWYPIAPLPFAVGTLVMLVDHRGRAVPHRLGARAGRARRLPGDLRASTSSTRAGWRRG